MDLVKVMSQRSPHAKRVTSAPEGSAHLAENQQPGGADASPDASPRMDGARAKQSRVRVSSGGDGEPLRDAGGRSCWAPWCFSHGPPPAVTVPAARPGSTRTHRLVFQNNWNDVVEGIHNVETASSCARTPGGISPPLSRLRLFPDDKRLR